MKIPEIFCLKKLLKTDLLVEEKSVQSVFSSRDAASPIELRPSSRLLSSESHSSLFRIAKATSLFFFAKKNKFTL
jgi:hypothetical protein